MRKIIASVLLMLLLVAMAVPVFATDSASMTISAGAATAYRGDTIQFTVRMTAVEDCRSAGIVLSYNSSVFEFVSGSCSVAGVSMSSFSGGTGSFALSTGTTVSGGIFTFTLRVKDDAPFGSYSVSGSGSARDSGGAVATSVRGASVQVVCDHSYSDWTRVDETSHTHTCSVCGDTVTAAHSWDASTINKYANCVSEGQKTLTCTACGESKVEIIPVTSYHSITAYTNVNETYHRGTCTVCRQAFSVGHTWDSGVVTKEPTCVEEGERLYTCSGTDCGATKTAAVAATGIHTYVHECDTQCTVCGNVRDAAHSYAEAWVTDKQSHYKSCVYCGEKAEHADHTPGAAPTANTAQTCTVCGYIIQPSLNHVHQPSESWITDENAHWRSCPGCSEQLELTVHDFDNVCDPLCESCGYTRTTSHVFSKAWSADESAHFLACTGCGEKSEVAAHTPGEAATEFVPQTCTVCSFEIVPALGHDFAGFWSWDADSHFHSCDCGTHTDAASHSWDSGVETHGVLTQTCTVCGAQSARLAPADWRLVVLLAVPFLLGGAAGVAVACLVKRRRR